jgi:hypothetical protein
MQGLDLNKVRGGRKGQQQLAQAVALESANRVLTRRALDLLKSIAVDEYKSPEERRAEAEIVPEEGEAARAAQQADVAPDAEAQVEETAPEAESTSPAPDTAPEGGSDEAS